MNYLAHLYLAENTPESRLGNLYGDFVKGKLIHLDYPHVIIKGIWEHRQIDTFTDHHPLTSACRMLIGAKNKRYSGIAADVIYDHFLAKNWTKYSAQPLAEFVQEMYDLLQSRFDTLPPKLQYVVPFLLKENWFMRYATVDGIQDVLERMGRRMAREFERPNEFAEVCQDLVTHYETFEAHFAAFFDDLQTYVHDLRKDDQPFLSIMNKPIL